MRTVITGGAGFLGAQLVARLLADANRGQVVVADRAEGLAALSNRLGATPRLELVDIDLCGPGAEIGALVAGADAVVHLASVVSADAEADPERAWQLNVEASRRLLAACGLQARGCRFLAASSVAVFSAERAPSGDATKPRPRSTYGMTKSILEMLVNEATRRQDVDGRVARLPTVIVRPGRPNLAASSFASGVFREPLAGIDMVVPVPPEVGLVVIGHRAAVAGLDALLQVPPAALGEDRGVNLPGLCVSVAEMIAACRAVGQRRGRTLGRITMATDPAIEAIVGSWPARWDAALAGVLALPADRSLEDVVEHYLDDFG